MVNIVVKNAGQEAYIREMEAITYEDMSEMVGGYIECIRVAHSIDMWCNDCGKLENLPLNLVLGDEKGRKILDTIQGDVFFASHDGEGNTIGLTTAQIKWVMNNLNTGDYAVLDTSDGIDFIPVWTYNPTAS